MVVPITATPRTRHGGLTVEQVERTMLFYFSKEPEHPFVANLAGPVLDSSANGMRKYTALGNVPKARKWIGSRVVNQLRDDEFVLRDDPYEMTLGLTRDEWHYGDLADVRAKILRDIDTSAEHWEDMTIDMIVAGDTAVSAGMTFDGQQFFDTDHVTGDSGTQSNVVSKSIVAAATPTYAEFEDALWTAIERYSSFKDDTGRPMNSTRARSFTIVVPHTMEKAATVALGADSFVESGAVRTNTLRLARRTTFDLIPSVKLTDAGWTTKFALFANTGDSLVRQQSVAPRRTTLGPDSQLYHSEGRLEFGMWWSRGMGYQRWHSAIQVAFATA